MPDRWWTWWIPGVLSGLRIVRQRRPSVLLSTYPVPTAHLIGWTLQRLTGVPWVAEFRDPMTDEIRHPRRVVRTVNRWLERATLEGCAAAIFVAPGARADYARRYSHVDPARLAVIPNGYDEDAFAGLEPRSQRREPGPLVLVHSGVLYPAERDPRPFLAALRTLHVAGGIGPRSLRVVLRATGYDAHYRGLVQEHGLTGIVTVEPPLPYRGALREMVCADALLLFQGSAVNLQIPAKAYEYLRARRPIFALTDPAGDTAAMLRAAGVGHIARLDSEEDIRAKLPDFLRAVARNELPVADDGEIARHSRRARTAELARLLGAIAARRVPGAA